MADAAKSLDLYARVDWDQGACRAAAKRGSKIGEYFFPSEGIGDPAHAKKMYNIGQQYCETCPIKADCLEYAEAAGERWGLWGGKTPFQRNWHSHGARIRRGPNVPG